MYARYIPPVKRKESTKPVAPESHVEPIKVSRSPAAPYARYIPQPKAKATEASNSQPQKIIFEEEQDFPIPKSKKQKRVKEDGTSAKNQLENPPIEPGAKDHDNLAKPRKKHKKLDDGASNGPNIASEDVKVSGAIQKKKKKKRKRADDEETNIENGSLPTNEANKVSPVVAGTSPGSESNEEEKKLASIEPSTKEKKNRKTKKRTTISIDESNDGSKDTHRSHKKILEKRERSLRATEALLYADNPVLQDEAHLGDAPNAKEQPREVHGLEPLPQPEPVNFDGLKPTYATLPPWLAAPIRVSHDARAAFTDLGISLAAAKILGAKGFKEAFAVQTATIPLLLPSIDRQGDIVISAATGSGKTLAYVLPMIRDISQGIVTKLRGLVVVPTRELVRQAQEACEMCASAFASAGGKRTKIGISMGSQSFRQDQAAIIEEEQVYDPQGYSKWRQKDSEITWDDSDDEDDFERSLRPTRPLPDHIVRQVSKVDILICTPGRLVEHIKHTRGFTLDFVRWLVVDEADKLLAQSYQQWLNIVMDKLSVDKPGARYFHGSNKTGVRKIILSATMTRDLSLLNDLKLRRPKLIVLEGADTVEEAETRTSGGEHVLPELLEESVIKVRGPNLKPLYLIDLLSGKHMVPMNERKVSTSSGAQSLEVDPNDPSQRDSSDVDSDDDGSSGHGDASDAEPPSEVRLNTAVLIFTKSNESALRLSRLLALLSPTLLGPVTGTLTSTTRTSHRRRTMRALATGRLRVLVASDLVARGIDLPALDHVVNYDIPTSAAAYVHRVGRTARAGRHGRAWTLVTNAEAAWFWREIGGEGRNKDGGCAIKRNRKVERVKLGGDEDGGVWFDENRVKAYEDVLEQLGQEVDDSRKKGM